jgi:DNA-binding response OmpR family regulator
MSPAGLASFEFGLTPFPAVVVVVFGVELELEVVVGVEVEVEVEVEVDAEPPLDPQPAATVASTAAVARSANFQCMPATVGVAGPAPVTPRSTPAQNSPDRRRRIRTLPAMAPQILVVEDDEAIASGLARVLESQGLEVVRTARGGEALERFESARLVILDLGLPDIDGITVCRRMRTARPDLAILILSARDQELDIVAGLDAGADDYLVKPFRLSELLARVRAHLRRTESAERPREEEVMEAGAIKVDSAARRAWRDGEELPLRPKEFELLSLLVAQAGRVVTRERIMEDVWQTDWMGSTKTLDTHILNLRQKIGGDAITTLRGVGYRLELP